MERQPRTVCLSGLLSYASLGESAMKQDAGRYLAVIGDIKDSRDLENRGEVQRKLKAVLDQINHNYRGEIVSEFLITLGDEFQGLMKISAPVLEIIKYIQRKMYPALLRFGIGIGEISTEINPFAAIGSDGPAYYGAREMIGQVHANEKKNKRTGSDIRLCVYGKKSFEADRINLLLSMIWMIEDDWSMDQRLTVWDMMEKGGSQEECAKRMKTHQSTIGRRLSAGRYYLYRETLDITERSIQLLEEKL